MLPQEQVQWLIPKIINASLYARDIRGKKEFEEQEAQLREQGKQIMLDSWLKKFEMLDGTIIQLNSTPWALVIAEWVQLDPKYYKEKTTITIDKVQVKKDFMEWLIFDPWVMIESTYNFVIKSK